MISFACGLCGDVLRADEHYSGRRIRCARCGHISTCPTRVSNRAEVPPASGGAVPAPRSIVRDGGIAIGVAAAISLAALLVSNVYDDERNDSGTANGVAKQSTVEAVPDAGVREEPNRPRTVQKIEPTEYVVELVPDSKIPEVTASRSIRASRTPDLAEAKERALFVESASKPGDPDLLLLFQEINTRHFAGALPPIPVNWELRLAEIGPLKAKGFVLQGVTDGDRILLNSALKTDQRKARAALCHEMVHVFLRASRGTNHGPLFQRELRRLLDEGAFEGLLLSEGKRREMGMRIDEESARIDAESASLDDARNELRLAKLNAGHQVDVLNDRISTANANGYGWPSDKEIEQARVRDDILSQLIADFNARVVRFRADQSQYNIEVERYNLAMSYPDGLDEESLIPIKLVAGRNVGR